MTKNQALGIITSAAKIYEEQFCNKNLLIVFGSPSHPRSISTKGDPRNFYHLTGVTINKQNLFRNISDKSSNTITVFYEKALKRQLSADDFSLKKTGYAEQKLRVINQTLQVSSNAVMIGDYYNCRINLMTDKIAGGQASFLGLVEVNGCYVPNTIIADDIRKNSINTERVLAVLSKKINEKEYNKIEKVAKKIEINKLLQTISKDVPVAENLISSSLVKSETKQVDQTGTIDSNRLLQMKSAVKKCDEILKANPALKAKLNIAAAEYCSKHNLPPFDSSLSADERYEMRNKVLKENPKLMEEYVKVKKEHEDKQLVPAAAKHTKSFAQGLDEFSKRPKGQSSPKPPEHNNSEHKRHK